MVPKTAVFKGHKEPVTSAVSGTRNDVPQLKILIFKAEPSSVNMVQCEAGEETKTTVYIYKKEQLRYKMMISKENLSVE